MNVRLKICGLRDNIKEVAALKPDYAGFIFYPPSPRYVGRQFEMPALDPEIKKVGVFVNEPVDKVLGIYQKYDLQFVQLHGDEKPEDCQELKEAGAGVIKAFSVDEKFDFGTMASYMKVADYFLFDTKTKSYGGSGKVFNWKVLEEYPFEKPYFLSGGLSLENLDGLMAMDHEKLHALDVNSKFEVKPGLKDVMLIEELIGKMSLGI